MADGSRVSCQRAGPPTDVMDESKGWQFLQMLKMDRDTRGIPVIACTAAARMAEELHTHLDVMGAAVVLKPFDIDVLLAEIARKLTPPTPH